MSVVIVLSLKKVVCVYCVGAIATSNLLSIIHVHHTWDLLKKACGNYNNLKKVPSVSECPLARFLAVPTARSHTTGAKKVNIF